MGYSHAVILTRVNGDRDSETGAVEDADLNATQPRNTALTRGVGLLDEGDLVPDEGSRFASGGRGYFLYFFAAFSVLLVLSNISATKLIPFGPEWSVGSFQILPVITDGGVFLFPLTYVVGDVLAEVYGFANARKAILFGFACTILASAVFLIVNMSPAVDPVNAAAWQTLLGFVPRITIASLTGYIAGQLLNAWVVVLMKRWTNGKGLWARLLGSTVIGELADTVLFCLIAFGGVITAPEMTNYIIYGYLIKVGVEGLLLPITTSVIKTIKRLEPDY